MLARLTVTTMVVLLQALVFFKGAPWGSAGLGIAILHLTAAAAGMRYLQPRKTHQPDRLSWPWLPTVGLDVASFGLIQSLAQSELNYTLLFALPVLMAATLGPLRRALATAALVTLLLLLDAARPLWTGLTDPTPHLFQTAIAGTGYFLIALLARQLAVRLAREEAAAERNELAVRTQSAVNAQIIETLSDGVLVVDTSGNVRAANPSARVLLNADEGESLEVFCLTAHAGLEPLLNLVSETFQSQTPMQAEIQLQPRGDIRHRLRVRTRPAMSSQDTAITGLCVVFLEDQNELEARVRTEKLAAMGRMSVAVAHEIRNPLSAISQANELLREDLTDPHQQRLAQMVANHTQRLNRIVDDILNVVRVPSQPVAGDVPLIELDAAVHASLAEWCTQHACTDRLQCQTGTRHATTRFDPEHLRRVMVNLLDNASRYASDQPGAIHISTRVESPGWLRLSVWSDGIALDSGIRRHLFEPFFSSESRSSGMGLYLCRELCDRYRARLDYQRSERDNRTGNEFYILMSTAEGVL